MEQIGDIMERGNYPKPTEAQKKSSETKVPDEDTIKQCEEMKAGCGYALIPTVRCAAVLAMSILI